MRTAFFILTLIVILSACNCGYSSRSKVSSPRGVVSEVIANNLDLRTVAEERRKFLSARTLYLEVECKAGVENYEVVLGIKVYKKDLHKRGSGVIIRSTAGSSYIFTAAHVASPKIPSGYGCAVSVKGDKFVNPLGLKKNAKVIAIDRKRDLAVLVVNRNYIVNSQLEMSPILGEDVYAAGFPLVPINPSGIYFSITRGSLANLPIKNKKRGHLLRVTSPISGGSSGGGLWTSQGKLLGITVSYLSFSDTGLPVSGQYYVKPVSDFVDLLKRKKRYREIFGGREMN